jgi:methyltransferase (TIGR00027 family)
MTADVIKNVAGTAFWIAHQRATETERAEPLFRDPWAAKLAGTRGAQIEQEIPNAQRHAWVNVTRIALLDRMIVEAVARDGIDRVVNLGAGLDTRPFRLELPAGVRWVDVDSPEILAHKASIMQSARPRCDYRSLSADLSVTAERQQTLDAIAEGAQRVLLITEGVLEYLEPAAVSALAGELYARSSFHAWLLNLVSPTLMERVQKTSKRLALANAAVRFTPAESSAFFEPMGWREADWRSLIASAIEFKRLPAFMRAGLSLLGANQRERWLRAIGVARLERAPSA